MKFPSLSDVAKDLRFINCNVENECDVRLCVWSDGDWSIRSGDASYDQSHSDFCGASCIPGVVNGVVQRFNSFDVARDLIEQCREQHACR